MKLATFSDADLLARIDDSMRALEERAHKQIELELWSVKRDSRIDVDQLRVELRKTVRKVAAYYDPAKAPGGMWERVLKAAIKRRVIDAVRTRPKPARNCPADAAVAVSLEESLIVYARDDYAEVDERLSSDGLAERLSRTRAALGHAMARIDAIEDDLGKAWLQGVLF